MLHGKEVECDVFGILGEGDSTHYISEIVYGGGIKTTVYHFKRDGYTFEPELVEVIDSCGVIIGKRLIPWTIVSETETEFCSKNANGDLWIRDKKGYSYRPFTPTTTLPDGRVFDTSKLNERLAGLPEEGKE